MGYVRGMIFNNSHSCTELSKRRAALLCVYLQSSACISRNTPSAYCSEATAAMTILGHQFLVLDFQTRKLLHLVLPLFSYMFLNLVGKGLVP